MKISIPQNYVANATERIVMLIAKISDGNGKLKKDRIATISLPKVLTCPGAGECQKWCYGGSGHYCFSDAKFAHERNFRATFEPEFVVSILTQLECLAKSWDVFRIHDCGDFYSQEYLNKWVEIMCKSEKRFYCYTKSLHLDWSEALKLKNFVRIQSEGGKFDDLIDYELPHARIFRSFEELNDAGYVDCSESDLVAATGNAVKVGLIIHGGNRRHF